MTTPQTIAYLRVSTTDQDIEKNKFDILQLANEKKLGQVEWVDETISGRVSWKKRKIADVIDRLQAGDTLIVSELSRLGRSMMECMEILSIASEKKIKVYAVKGGRCNPKSWRWCFRWSPRLNGTLSVRVLKRLSQPRKGRG